MTPAVFISYSNRDVLTATVLCKALEEAGHSCWIAPRNIPSGQTWSEAIIDGINASQVMVLLYSASSNASPQVLREIERAVSKQLGLLTFRAEDVPLSKAMEYLISISHWLDATSGPLEAHLARLVEGVQSLLATRGVVPASLLTPVTAPTPVLLPPPAPSTPVLPPHNLPVSVTSFVGRAHELTEIKARLAASRLLTLMGSGGSGKTRLALQTGSDLLADYPEGVWLVELAALTDAGSLVQTVASVLGVKEQPGQTLLQTLLGALSDRRMLLILDNCEHLPEGCSDLVSSLLRSCAHLKLLATSRSALNLSGESLYRVPALSLPGGKKAISVEALLGYEAVKLFVDRAVLTQPAFVLSEGNAPWVVQICRRLDGLPLALELAAARVRAMSVDQIASRLDERFKLLTGGSKTGLAHQQTLRALMDWSYALLSAEEKVLLGRLSVFAGGWRLEEAEFVCAELREEGRGKREEKERDTRAGKREKKEEDLAPGQSEGRSESGALFPLPSSLFPDEVLDLLFSLVDKSLVVYEEGEETARYRLLETVRQYSREKLMESGESESVHRHHRDCFLALAEEAELKMGGPQQGEWFERLEKEHENLREALAWSLSEETGAIAGLRFCGALRQFWWTRGHLSEGREWCGRALEKAGAQQRTPERAKVLNAAGTLAYMQSDYASARANLEESLHISREIGDRKGIAGALNGLGNIAGAQGNYAQARTYYEESLSLWREIGDWKQIAALLNNLGIAALYLEDITTARDYYEQALKINREIGNRVWEGYNLIGLGNMALNEGDYAGARAYHEESLSIVRELGDRNGIGTSLLSLGIAATGQGDYASARTLLEQSLSIWQEIGDRQKIAYTLNAFASLNIGLSRLEQAGVLWGVVEALRAEIGSLPSQMERDHHDQEVAEVLVLMGEEALSTALAKGRAMAMEQAISYALDTT